MDRLVATWTGMEATPMSQDHVRPVTDQTFEAEVLSAEVPVLVDFTATWCPPCRALEPILHALAAENAGRLAVRTVNGDDHAALAARYRIKAFPTVIAFAGGKEVARHVGLTTGRKLLALVAGALGSP
jgi:thioredoxin 1